MNRFKVTEWFNGYELEDTVTGLTAWLGDGVDVFTMDDGQEEVDLLPGTPELLEYWNQLYNQVYSIESIFEGHWPDYYDLGILDLEVSAQAYAVHLLEESP